MTALHDGRVYFMCQSCEEHNPEGAVGPRSDIAVMPDGTWLCDGCYSDCDKAAYGLVASDIDDFVFPRFEDLPRPAPYHEAPQCEVQSGDAHYLSAIRKRLEQLYDASADNPRLREQLSDEVDWVDVQFEAPNVVPITHRWRSFGAQTWIYDPEPEWLEDHKFEVEWEPVYGAPQPATVAQAPTNRQLHDAIASAVTHRTYSGIQDAVREIQKLYASSVPSASRGTEA